MHDNQRLTDHQRFKELAALAQGRGLTISERIELKSHLESCQACRAISGEYALLSSQGMDFLAADLGHVLEAEAWDYRTVQNDLTSRIRDFEHSAPSRTEVVRFPAVPSLSSCGASLRWAAAGVAACLMIAVGTGAYEMGS